jgi:hypothetical protein
LDTDGVGDAHGGEPSVLASDDGELGDDGLAVESELMEHLGIHVHQRSGSPPASSRGGKDLGFWMSVLGFGMVVMRVKARQRKDVWEGGRRKE